MKKEFEFDEDSYISAKFIVQDEGLDVDTAINMFFKKIVKENTIGFLFNRGDNNISSTSVSHSISGEQINLPTNKMTKSLAKRLFLEKGIRFSDNYIFSSENSSTHIFWANFHYNILTRSWMIVLNDKSKNILHLFSVPANAIRKQDLVMRADKPEIVDLQIAYNDPTFTDNRSGVSFSRFLTESINY